MNLPEPRYNVKVLRHSLIPMRDGVRLSANLCMPDAEGRFPAILWFAPYHKGDSTEPWVVFRFFAERGYVIAQVDVRGTGDSEGATTDAWSPEEIQDGCEVVEWLARQSWCDGNVGMWGISYPAVAAMQVAMHNPPHLKAIVVEQGMDELYGDFICPGGSPRIYPYEQYAPLMTVYNFAPPTQSLCGEQWAEIWKHHLDNNVPWGIGFVTHLLDGPYWRVRSVPPDYDRIKCPTFFIGGWADGYATGFLRAMSELKVPKRALIGPWGHSFPEDALPGPRIDSLPECLRWFDRWLKGIENDIEKEPPLTIFVREFSHPSWVQVEDRGRFRAEAEWPLARVKETPMYLHPDGVLIPTPSNAAEGGRDEHEYKPDMGLASGRYVIGQFPPGCGLAGDQRPDEVYSLTYTTSPLETDTEVTGQPRAVLFVSSTADVAYFAVKLCDVAPDGTSLLVAKGGLNATHRCSHAEPAPLELGRIYELPIPLTASAYLFRAGHRIRVDIASADFQNAWPTPRKAVNSVYRGERYPSRIILPIVPPQAPLLPEPILKPSANPLPRPEAIYKPEFSITHDMASETTTLRYETTAGSGVNRSSYTVSAGNPACAVVRSEYEDTKKLPGMTIRLRSQCVTSSDEKAFHHVVEAEITINDRPHFQKSWSISVPRKLC